jgi:hypothetical protein
MIVKRHKMGARYTEVVLAADAQLRLSASKRGDSVSIRIASDSDSNPQHYTYALTLADDAEILQLHAWLSRYVVKMTGLGAGKHTVRWQ